MKARDIMTPDPITISPDAGVGEAVKILLEKHFNGLPVVDESGTLIGVICQSDLVAQQKQLDMPSLFTLFDGFIPMSSLKKTEADLQKITALTVEQAMTKKPVFVKPDASLEELATLMVRAKYYSLPVVENDRVIGIVGKEDILRTVVQGD